MTKTDDIETVIRSVTGRGEELVSQWESRWSVIDPMTKDEAVQYLSTIAESAGQLLADVKAVRDALAANPGNAGTDTDAQLNELRKKVLVVQVRSNTAVKYMTTPFVPRDADRFAEAMDPNRPRVWLTPEE